MIGGNVKEFDLSFDLSMWLFEYEMEEEKQRPFYSLYFTPEHD